MNDTVKIKKGYKQTDIGVIPEDWEVKKIGDVLKIKHGKSQSEVKSENGDYPILGSGGIIGRAFKPLYDKPSVLIGRKGTIDEPQFMDSPFWTIDTLFYSEIKDNVSPKFIYYKFNTIDWYAYNEASGVPSLNANTIENILISIPDLNKEQFTIAEVLSDTDELISNLEKLIEKKRQIKKGAMQELLTGNKRLPGFTDEWREKRLEDIVIFKNGAAHEKSITEHGDYIVINSKFISTEGEVAKYSNICFCPVSVNEITMVMSDVPNGKAIAKCFYVDKDNKYTLNQRICSLKTKNDDSKFLYYLLDRNSYFLTFDDGVKQTNLRKDDILNCILNIPNDKTEQKAIAEILSNMDSEIEVLEQKLEKYKQIKQGMMQELLTGKTRIK